MEKKKKYMLLGIIGALIVLIGGSYAYWRLTLTQTGLNEVASSCFSITLTNEQNEISLQKAAPISDEDGKKLTPFTFTIKNNCDTYASYTINLELLNTVAEESRLSAEFIKAMIDEETPFLLNTTPATTTLENAYESYTLTTGYLDANEERNYSLRLWMDQDVTIEDDAMNKQLESKITITASYIDHMPTDYERCVEEYGEDSIQCSIIADASDEETGSCPTVNEDGTVTVTSEEETNGYICSAPDDYGTSYYYRGNVTNNYVKFAGFYWRILRINGDGSIRMIYAGDADVIDALDNKEEVLANGYNDSSTDYTQIGTSKYNSRSNNNAYVGYMYGENYWGEPTTSESTSSRTLNSYYYYYADSYTFDTSTGTYTLTNPTKAIWNESLVGKYTCRDNEDTSCSTLYYIDSYSSASNGYTLSYTSTNTDGVYTENHGTSTTYRTMADYYYYGTGYTFDKTTGYFALTGTSMSVYDGSQVGTYTCGSASSSCETLYYVESTNDTTTANVRTISRTGTTYEETHANINNSTIKTRVDTWYEENILNTEYEQYISDTLFCNDRSLSSGTGIGAVSSDYGPYRRWQTDRYILTCPNKNDSFTVEDESKGNGNLTYPVGLLAFDEVVLAGGYRPSNSGYYLYTGNHYWTMSPAKFNGSIAFVRYVNGDGNVNIDDGVFVSYGVRPVINLKPNSLKLGDGTALSPYMVEEEI